MTAKNNFFISLLLITWFTGNAFATPADTSASPVLPEETAKEIKLDERAFSRGEPVPNWTEQVSIPESQSAAPLVIKLANTQFNVAETPEVFVHRALQINQSSSLGQAGQLPIYFVPEYQKLKLHMVRILRGKEVIDQTKSVNVRFLQRETQYESGVYNGTVTVALLLSDVRVGDTVEYAYTTSGINPVFNGKYVDQAGWDHQNPVSLRLVTLNFPSNRNIHWRMIGDFGNTRISPKSTVSNGIQQLRFEERDIKAVEPENYIPYSYLPMRYLQFSEFQNWNEVAIWAAGLFPPVSTLPDELKKLVDRLKSMPSDEDRVIEALRWTQSEIRYFSVSIGESSHRPYSPEEVIQRRYGDCKDKAYLLTTLLQQVGIRATPILLSYQERNAVEKMLPAPDVFDHAIVKVDLNGKHYYLDGTQLNQKSKLDKMGTALDGINALVADTKTLGLAPIISSVTLTDALDNWDETLKLPKFGEPATMDITRFWVGANADAFRLYFSELSPEQLGKFAAANLEKRYPGIDLIGTPTIQDDPLENRLVLKAHFKIPKLEVDLNGGWGIRYFPGILQGMFNVPENLKRNFPVAMPYPYTGHYTLSLEWPSNVSVVLDPSVEKLDGKYFYATLSQQFRGNKTSIKLDFSIQKQEVPVKELPEYVENINKLNKLIGSIIIIDRNSIKNEGLFGIGKASLMDTTKQRLNTQIDRYSKAINSGRLKGEDLAETYCNRASAFADTEKIADGLKDSEEALRIAPQFARAWFCHGDMNYYNGNFSVAISDMTKALSLGYDESTVYRSRAMAKYFLGKLEAATADMQLAVDINQNEADKTYAKLWLASMLKQQGKPIPEALLEAVKKNPHGDWPQPVLAMLTETITPEQMHADLMRKTGDDLELCQTEAMFYLGQYYLAQGKTDLAIQEFKKVREKGISMYTEYVAAGFELRRLNNK